MTAYKEIQMMLEELSEPDRTILSRILTENLSLFREAPGSRHNHQAWKGGYFDHVSETMNLAFVFYRALGGRLPFTVASALKVMFLHDIEKPWRFRKDKRGRVWEFLKSKKEKAEFRQGLMEDYGVILTPDEANAMRYVEGEHRRAKPSEQVEPVLARHGLNFHEFGNAYTYIEGSHGDYRNSERTEGPLATFCHLWWSASFGVLRNADAVTPAALHDALNALRPLPFASDSAEEVIRLYRHAEKTKTPFAGSSAVAHLRLRDDAWKDLLAIERYPGEDPLPFRMGPLAAFCHMCDVTSARLWPHHPLAKDDPWRGAMRCDS